MELNLTFIIYIGLVVLIAKLMDILEVVVFKVVSEDKECVDTLVKYTEILENIEQKEVLNEAKSN